MINVEWPLFSAASSQIILLAVGCVALIADLFAKKRFPHLAYGLVQLGLLFTAIMNLSALTQPAVVSFSGLLVNDVLARLLVSFICLTSFFTFIYSRNYVAERYQHSGEYYILGVFSCVGMIVLASAHSLLTIYLGLELLSLPLYAMVALKRDSLRATEAAIKYFVMGAIASGMLLYGMSMLYGATAALDISEIARFLATNTASSHLVVFGLVFLVAGIGFKLAAAPFHMWAPDVYAGAPSSVTLFLATAPKLAALGMAMRLLVIALPAQLIAWQQLIITLVILSLAIGNVLAVAQTNIKRLLAYSTISQVGYLLLGFAAGTAEGYSAALFYIVSYALMSLAAFGLVVLLSRQGVECEQIDDLKGLSSRSPWLAGIMLIVMFSMAGIPPTVGFFAKLFVLQAVVSAGNIWLAVVSVLFAIIGAFYYIRVVKVMYFDEPSNAEPIRLPLDANLAISINGISLLALGLFPTTLLTICRLALSV